ncbi:MAG: YebC/PmpR family DNA-binding transcriptional regulator [Myxococcales bacterium]|nr:YebC/PmpR family DNA-binding transcriptional regulator [Myxococcales bacterium]
MSGHNKWSTIKHKKGKADAARGKIFTKCIKEITIAAKLGGGDVGGNPRLRKAVLDARSNNMPADNIARAIKKGTGELDGVVYEEISYEGYGPGGVAVLIDVTTDNRNRAITEVRTIMTKNGGKMAEPGAVGYLFQTVGQIAVAKGALSEDAIMEKALDAGANDVQDDGDDWTVVTDFSAVYAVREALETAGVPVRDSKVAKVASLSVELAGKDADTMMKLMDALEESDEVQNVWANFELDDDTARRLNDAA